VHLVGFTIEMYYDARLYVRQICGMTVRVSLPFTTDSLENTQRMFLSTAVS